MASAPNPLWLTARRIRVLLFLLPSLYFVLIFWPAIAKGWHYGNLPNQEKLATELGSYKVPADASTFAQRPEMIHPDYELLYEPSNREIQRAFRNGRLPLYNMHRLLGTVLWGSPVADAANPLSLTLFFFSPDQVQLIKIYVYTLLGFWGVYLCATEIFGSAAIPAFVAATIYLLNPFSYYMYHWASLYGVINLVPLLFVLTHWMLESPRFAHFVWIEIVFAWILLINQVQALLYFALFLVVWLAAGWLAKFYSTKQILRAAPILVASFAGGAALSLGNTWFLLQTGKSLARKPHTFLELFLARPRLLGLRPLADLWGNQSALATSFYDSTMIFFPIVVFAVLFVVCFGARRRLTRKQGIMGLLLWLLTVHCFLFPLHYPLYLLHLPLYNLNWEHWRIVYLFYLAVGLAAAFSLTSITGDVKIERRKILALFCGGGVALYALTVIRGAADGSPIFLPLTAALGLGVLGHGLWHKLSQTHVTALAMTAIAACLYLPMTRVPFYDPSLAQKTFANEKEFSEGVRSMRLVSYDEIAKPAAEMLWFNDSVMAMFSRNGATGYDTALEQREADLFSAFYSPKLKRLRSTDPLLQHGVQSSIAWPEAEGVLTAENQLSKINLARLQLLGVGHLLSKQKIPNLGEPRWDPLFNRWDHALPNASPVSLLRGVSGAEVARLFTDAAEEALADKILDHRQIAKENLDESSGELRAELPSGKGLVVATYNIGRFYRPFVSGAPATAESTNVPFMMIQKNAEPPAHLELRPQTRGIWLVTLAGILLSFIITAIAKAKVRILSDSGDRKPVEEPAFV